MILRYTAQYNKWFEKLPFNVKDIVRTYIKRVLDGTTSNCKTLREGISEIKIHYQKGYRVYYTILENDTILFLILGSDKDGQGRAMERAIRLKRLLKEQGVI